LHHYDKLEMTRHKNHVSQCPLEKAAHAHRRVAAPVKPGFPDEMKHFRGPAAQHVMRRKVLGLDGPVPLFMLLPPPPSHALEKSPVATPQFLMREPPKPVNHQPAVVLRLRKRKPPKTLCLSVTMSLWRRGISK
jgi:hypothetical protein